MVVGAFSPWLTVLGISISGIDAANGAWVVIVAAAIGVGIYYAMRRRSDAGVWPLLAGLAAVAVTVYDRQSLQVTGVFAGVVQIGWGLNLALIASVSMAIAGIVAIVQARRVPSAEPLPPWTPAEQSPAPVEQEPTRDSEPLQWPPAPGWAREPPPETPDEDA